MLKLLLPILISTSLGLAQSHPSWWTYASPEATALVGIQWQYMRNSPLAGAVAGELAPGGGLRFPDLPILADAQQILVSSPELLAIEYGVFPVDTVRAQAQARGLRRSYHEGVEMWVTRDPETLSLAQISESVVLLGFLDTLRDAVDRSMEELEDRVYSPLLARGARYADQDLWVVATQLPDPLASRFVPIETEAQSFEGSLGLFEGMHIVASIGTRSPEEAVDLADLLLQSVSTRPAMARGTDVSINEDTVLLTLDINERELADSLRGGDAESDAAVRSTQPAADQAPDRTPDRAAGASAPRVQVIENGVTVAAPGVEVSRTPPRSGKSPGKRRMVRIHGVAEGTREIPLTDQGDQTEPRP